MINKGRRQQITRLKHLKRCKALGLKPKESYWLKAQGKPCSCFMCSPYKYDRSKQKKLNVKLQ